MATQKRSSTYCYSNCSVIEIGDFQVQDIDYFSNPFFGGDIFDIEVHLFLILVLVLKDKDHT